MVFTLFCENEEVRILGLQESIVHYCFVKKEKFLENYIHMQ